MSGVIDELVVMIIVMGSQVCLYAEAYQIVHFKYGQFISCHLHLSKVCLEKKKREQRH
jgi:hypothetical protein